MSVFDFLGTMRLPHCCGMVKLCSLYRRWRRLPQSSVVMLSSADLNRLTKYDAGLPLSKHGYLPQRTPRISPSMATISSGLHRHPGWVVQALRGVCRAMSHTNPTSSRAMADRTRGCGLPVRLRSRYRLQSRVCAFQPISLICCGRCADRFRYG